MEIAQATAERRDTVRAGDLSDCLAGGSHCGCFKPPSAYPAIRGAADWSVNWDAANGFGYASAIAPHLGTLP